MGSKRTHSAMEGDITSSVSPVMPMFEFFRAELDEHHDRRERIIKASRDITATSKKIIFALQRVRTLQAPLPANVASGTKQHFDAIYALFISVARDLQGLHAHRYARQISGGCQEYLEAVLFEYYLRFAQLLSYDEAQTQLANLDTANGGIELSPDDYLLGIYDFTGELMRFAITTMATSGSVPLVNPVEDANTIGNTALPASRRNVLTDMRELRAALESLDPGAGPFARDVDKKMHVMRESVEKVEKALYGLTVRGAERPKGWMPDTSDAGRAVEVEG